MTKVISKLNNNIEYLYKQNANTPRMALCLNFSINKADIKPGVYSLMARLLLQGTKNYNSEQLANEFEKYAIDFSSEMFHNYFRVKFVCLNEDFAKAIELMNEVITNSTFEEFEKERLKLKNEIMVDLDSPRALAMDAYCRKIFEGHYYCSSLTTILNSIDSIEKEDVVEAFNYIINNSKKSLAVVGSLSKDEIDNLIIDTVGNLPDSIEGNFLIPKPELNEIKEAETIKADLNQAHIVKGWLVPTSGDEDYPALILLNIILGSCGLSSRLFTELRDKKGLAYVVRSSYETFKLAANFMIYIATEPKNIEVSLKGFDEEIEKIKTILVSEKELADAKNNFIGRCAFSEETNLHQACQYAKNNVLGFDFNYVDSLKEKVKAVTAQQILDCAQRCFNDKYVISITKP